MSTGNRNRPLNSFVYPEEKIINMYKLNKVRLVIFGLGLGFYSNILCIARKWSKPS